DGIRDSHVTGVQTCALPICEELNKQHAKLRVIGDEQDSPRRVACDARGAASGRATRRPGAETTVRRCCHPWNAPALRKACRVSCDSGNASKKFPWRRGMRPFDRDPETCAAIRLS